MSDTTTGVPKKKAKKPEQKAATTPKQDEQVVRLPLAEMHYFKGYPALRGIMPGNQPYQVRDDDPSMQQIAARVKERGVRQPAIVRPDPEGGYEIIAGHCRHHGSELADSNVQREDVLPSEGAWAYRMRLEVEKHQGARTDLTSPKFSAKLKPPSFLYDGIVAKLRLIRYSKDRKRDGAIPSDIKEATI